MDYTVSTDKKLLDVELITSFLIKESYWGKDFKPEEIRTAIEKSICFGAYNNLGNQVGFARVISDCMTIAYATDVFVHKDHRGKGISKLLLQAMFTYPELQTAHRWLLVTKDAQDMYKPYGFAALKQPETHMERIKKQKPKHDHFQMTA